MNIVAMLQRWMDSKIGQTFLNYAYSWGASIVILGTLFKLTHIPGANLMLFIGMGTEVVVFFLSAFDRPFEKGSIEINDDLVAETPDSNNDNSEETQTTTSTVSGPAAIGGTIVIAGGNSSATASTEQGGNEPATGPFVPSEGLQAAASAQGLPGNSLLDIIRLANEELLQRAQSSLTPEMEEASKQYVEKLQLLTETLDRVEKQSARLTTDSEEMTNLNRTLTGINTVYELQLKSVSQQIGTIDSINEQTRHMAAQIEELNGVYSRMIKALTVNMKNAPNTMGD